MSRYIEQDIGGYHVIEQIGAGGMARVYKAYQSSFDRFIALKILPDLYADDETYLARFKQEAKIIAGLEHSHILPVYDFGEDQGVTYLAMRYLRAGTLKDVLACSPGHRLPMRDAVRIVIQIADALDYAHRRGIIHRDVKPSNIMIDDQGDAFLMDFGIAKILDETAHLTKSGAAVGTPAYMSPEQGAGQMVDARSDIYSLGIMLYEMLTGRVPFSGDTPFSIIMAHAREPLPLPSSLMPDISEEVEKVLYKVLAKDPDDRYQSAGELSTALAQAVGLFDGDIAWVASPELLGVSGELSETKPSDEVTRDVRIAAAKPAATAQPRSRRMAPLLMGGLGILLVVVIGSLLTRGFGMFAQAIPAATATGPATEPSTAADTPADTPTPLPTPTPIGGGTGLIAFAIPSESDSLPVIYVMNADGSNPVPLTDQQNTGQPAWSPDGTKIAYTVTLEDSSEVYIMNADGSDPYQVTIEPGGGTVPSWSPDGTKLAFASTRDGNEEIYVINVYGSNLTRLTDNSWNDTMPVWSPDGDQIVFVTDRHETAPGNFSDWAGYNTEIYVMNADGSNQRRLTDNESRDEWPAWSPDGSKIAFSSTRDEPNPPGCLWDTCIMEIYVMDADGSNPTRLTISPLVEWWPAWSPDGTRIAYSAYYRDSGLWEIWAMNADGSNPVMLTRGGMIPSWQPGTGTQTRQTPQEATSQAGIMMTNTQRASEANATATIVALTPTASPTPHPAVGFAEPILAAIADLPPAYEDDFSTPYSGQWGYDLVGNGESGLIDGQLFIKANPFNNVSSAYPGYLGTDFIWEIEGAFHDIPEHCNCGWGVELITIGADRGGSGSIQVTVWTDLRLTISVSYHTETVTEIPAKESLLQDGTQRLVMISKGSQFAVYVNGVPVFYNSEIFFESVPYAGIKLHVTNGSSWPIEARFDNVRYWDISALP